MSEIIYRIPFQGSKQAIVKKIYDAINQDIGNTNDLFSTCRINKIYDLFCGGGSVGYYFAQKGYEVEMNDINSDLIELHKQLQIGIDYDLLYKWISREEFNEIKTQKGWYAEMIRICWSFGNNKRNYLYGKHIENYKKQFHFIVVEKDIKAGKNFLEMIGQQSDWNTFSKVYDIENQKDRRLFIRSFISKNKNKKELGNLESLQSLQSLERLESLQSLESLERLKFENKNYYDFTIEKNSIVYLDPPYINTLGYDDKSFDFEKFDNWVREMKEKGIRVYISEYTNHNNEWREVASFDKISLASGGKNKRKAKQEKIFCNI